MNRSPAVTSPPVTQPLVVHVVAALDFGGVEKHMAIIGSHRAQAEMRHVFVAIGHGGAAERHLRAAGADVRCLGKKVRIPSFGALMALLRIFRQERPAVVHTHGAEANFHGLLAAWLARVPVRIGEEIGIPSHSAKAQRVFRLVYLTAHRVIGVSAVVTRWLRENREVSAQKLVSIDNPVRLPALQPSRPDREGPLRVVFVGRLEAVKNPSGLLAGFSLLSSQVKAAELWFVGDGSERAALEKTAQEMNLANKVSFFGFQEHPETYIAQCDVFVQPSLSEGFSIGLVEAMACGVPVISTAVGSAPEIVEPSRTGWLLPHADPLLIAAVLKEAWDLGPTRLEAMGRNARMSVEGRFEPVDYLNRIETLYVQSK
jgi:glycosyltransferase involved in cell wall biosynthesis